MGDSARSRVLVIDDDPDMCWAVRQVLANGGLDVAEANSGQAGLDLLASRPHDALLLDMQLPGLGGREVLRHVQRRDASLPVIVLTGHGSIADAVEAVKTGVFEYLTKPFRNEHLLETVRRAIGRRRTARASPASSVRASITGTMGNGPAVHRLIAEIEAVAATDYSVLVLGETGSGKEVVARTLHQHGPRAVRPLVVVDCGAVVETLTDSEFFGHEKGAYTGANARQVGWFEMAADGGTIFLDEIGNLCLPAQRAMLRALDQRVIYRVGGTVPIKLDARVIAATNENLTEHNGTAFREDLFFRLSEYIITVPPLRSRPEDIEFLAHRFLAEARKGLGRPTADISSGALDLLRGHDWPGNVRELRNVIRRVALAVSDVVTIAHVAGCLGERAAAAPMPIHPQLAAAPLRGRIRHQMREIERGAVLSALEQAGGNKAQAARLLGVDYKTYRTKLKALSEPLAGRV